MFGLCIAGLMRRIVSTNIVSKCLVLKESGTKHGIVCQIKPLQFDHPHHVTFLMVTAKHSWITSLISSVESNV